VRAHRGEGIAHEDGVAVADRPHHPPRSIAILNDASIINTIPAPIHNAGTIPERFPEFGKKIRAAEDSSAPVRKYGFLLPIRFQVLSL
jgi:hypothetical protein